MSGKLDQSLDTIMAETGGNKRGGKGKRNPRRAAAPRAAKATIAAPTGGVQKSTRAPRNAPTAPAVVPSGDSKIIVSNLPQDISETQLKDFFVKAVGNVRKVLLSYGPDGRSRGEATVTFNKATKAADAHKQFNNVKVDNRPMRIEIVGGATAAQAKSLADRIAKPKNAAKEVTKKAAAASTKTNGAKAATNGAEKAARPAREKKSGRSGRPKAKTAEELDAEMADYFGPSTTANGETATNGTAAATGGDAAMQTDEIS